MVSRLGETSSAESGAAFSWLGKTTAYFCGTHTNFRQLAAIFRSTVLGFGYCFVNNLALDDI